MTPPNSLSIAPNSPAHTDPFAGFVAEIWAALGGDPALSAAITQSSPGDLPSALAATDLATASIATAGLAVAQLADLLKDEGRANAHTGANNNVPRVSVDRRLASAWFSSSYRPVGWTPAPPWDAVAGDYQGKDGWIRLHTNAPHHRKAALAVLDIAEQDANRDTVAAIVATWPIDALETAIVEKGGCAAAMRSIAEWRDHPQGQSVASEPLIHLTNASDAGASDKRPLPRFGLTGSVERPLAGVRVLDLTRVLAGPVATRFLAGFGADVLRIDPPEWDEPGVLPDVALGKRCARLDLRNEDDRAQFRTLLAEADILVHGYRADALDRLGLGDAERRAINPGLIDVALNAYGWRGPWRYRRGFDSLVQMSSGIADLGMQTYHTDRPKPLPVQALDHATGYILAACAIRGLIERHHDGHGKQYRTSLARVAALLCQYRPDTGLASPRTSTFSDLEDADYRPAIEQSGWGKVERLRPPLEIDGVSIGWTIPAECLGTSAPQW
jgi:crotonobetainyl-CoA:carnitine CoA-transferase CaiB-like acyl-CoA transferase